MKVQGAQVAGASATSPKVPDALVPAVGEKVGRRRVNASSPPRRAPKTPSTGVAHGAAHSASKPPASRTRWAVPSVIVNGADASSTAVPPSVASTGPGTATGGPERALVPGGPGGPCAPAAAPGPKAVPGIVSVPPLVLKAVPLIVMCRARA